MKEEEMIVVMIRGEVEQYWLQGFFYIREI